MVDTCDIVSAEYMAFMVPGSPPRMGTRLSTEHALSTCPRNTQEPLFIYFRFQAKPLGMRGINDIIVNFRVQFDCCRVIAKLQHCTHGNATDLISQW